MYKDEYKKQIEECLMDYIPSYGESIRERYKGYSRICIWGCGNMGRVLPQMLSKFGVKVDCYCDNDPQKVGTYPHGYGIPCISPEELKEDKENTVVIVPTRYYPEIYKQLKEEGYKVIDRLFHVKFTIDEFLKKSSRQEIINNILNTIDLFEDEESCRIISKLIKEWTINEYEYGQLDDICTLPQYFPDDIVSPYDCEYYVDCGAYNGDNVDDFLKFTKGNFAKYYAFELNRNNCNELIENISSKWKKYKDRFVVENSGVSDKAETIFYFDNSEGSKIRDNGDVEGKTVTLDEFLENDKVSFIKMDIEGSEIPAINGAKKIITRDLPTLAICIYHKPDDFWTIPTLIKENWPSYKLYVRHHTTLTTETVLYAIQ